MQSAQAATGERRQTLRRAVTWRVLLLRADGEQCEGICTDIGDDGVGFRSPVALRAGEIVALQFPGVAGDAEAAHRATCAQVIYRIGDQYGASFLLESE